MTLKLKTKQDRQIWQFLSPNQREFAKSGKCINLTADYLPEDIPTRFVFVCLNEILEEFIKKERLDYRVEYPIKVFFREGLFSATTQHPRSSDCSRFNLPSAIIRTQVYENLPTKYQELVLSKVDMSFDHISKYVTC